MDIIETPTKKPLETNATIFAPSKSRKLNSEEETTDESSSENGSVAKMGDLDAEAVDEFDFNLLAYLDSDSDEEEQEEEQEQEQEAQSSSMMVDAILQTPTGWQELAGANTSSILNTPNAFAAAYDPELHEFLNGLDLDFLDRYASPNASAAALPTTSETEAAINFVANLNLDFTGQNLMNDFDSSI